MKKISSFFTASFIFLSTNLSLAFVSQSIAQDSQYQISATKLDESRNKLSVKTGNSSFSFDQEDVNNLPLGQATQLNQVLQRAAGVVVNSQNQIHVRGDHSNLQYRINGVMLPEGVNGFGQSLDTHFAESIDLLTGSMPAQFGLRTAGVVDIKTKSGRFENKNRSEFTVGGNDTIGGNQQIGGSSGNLDYYLSANYLQNSRGIESTTAARNSNHNDTTQDNVFGYFNYLLSANQRLSVIISNANNRFEIPNSDNRVARFTLDGATADNNFIDQKQREASRFAVVALQGITDSEIDYQISLFSRYSDLKFTPDYTRDLIYSGVSSRLDRRSFANGTQGDFAYQLNEKNTLRSGFYFSQDRVKSDSVNFVFEGDGHDDDFVQTSTTAKRIDENNAQNSEFYSAYLQNEWQATSDLTINYGARIDVSHAYVNESQISPRLNAVYNLSEQTSIHAGYSRFFTPPPVSSISDTNIEQFHETSNEPEVEKNGRVKAERSNYFDLGITHKATKNLTLALDGYYKQSKNVLDEHQFGNTLIYIPFNYEEGKSFGAEFKADYQKDNFAAYLNFAAQRAYGRNVISGEYVLHEEEYQYAQNNYIRLDHVQNYTASIGASYLLMGNRFSADALYGSGLSTGDNNKNTMPSYVQVNASISRDISLAAISQKAGKFNLRFSAINLFDNVYQYSDGSSVGVNAARFAPRRTFYMIVSKTF
jgi:outer membrane receptor protein involved in Fe transport